MLHSQTLDFGSQAALEFGDCLLTSDWHSSSPSLSPALYIFSPAPLFLDHTRLNSPSACPHSPSPAKKQNNPLVTWSSWGAHQAVASLSNFILIIVQSQTKTHKISLFSCRRKNVSCALPSLIFQQGLLCSPGKPRRASRRFGELGSSAAPSL